MLSRRGFLLAAAGITTGASLTDRRGVAAEAPVQAGQSAFGGVGLRSITYNLYGCKGWPERRGNRARLAAAQPHLPERIALELALYSPDIITVAEAPEEGAVKRLAAALGMTYAYYPSPEGFPGALLTRFAIVVSANCPLGSGVNRPAGLLTRHFGRAELETPDGRLVVYNAHLHPRSAGIRLDEIAVILEAMKPDIEADRSLLLQGDLNHRPRHAEYEVWTRAGLIDAQAAVGAPDEGTVSSITPGARIDYIWVRGPIATRLVACRPLFEGVFRLNRDDPAAFALSDHLPVLAEFR